MAEMLKLIYFLLVYDVNQCCISEKQFNYITLHTYFLTFYSYNNTNNTNNIN